MDKHTSKARVADTTLAGAALINASGTGSSLFVINLCASMAPAANLGKSLPGLEAYRLYQVARREDGRTRYRLRLGFFTSEADAEGVLSTVRDAYPTAFTACLCDEDRKFARGFTPEPGTPAAPAKMTIVERKAPAPVTHAPIPAAAAKGAAPLPAPAAKAATPTPVPAAAKPTTPVPAAKPAAPAPTPAAKTAAPTPAAKSTATARTPTATPAPVEIELSWEPSQPAPVATPPVVTTAKTPAAQPKAPPRATIDPPAKLRAAIELSLESEPTPAPTPQVTASTPANEPFRVSKGIDLPTTSLSLESTNRMRAITPAAAAKPVAKPAAPVAAPTPAASASDTTKMKAAHAAAPAAVKQGARPSLADVPELDSTQTIRALTSAELQDESQEKWFAIQLAVSDQPVNLEAMPRLDIFEAYRLYSVASAGSGKITHSLRIGFFREEVSAEAVSGYLKTFFASPTVVRISIAEQARFKDAPAQKHTPAPKAEVLDLSHARERTSKPIPTVTMEVATPRFDPNATGGFKTSASGAHKALASATGAYNALASSTGVHKALATSTGAHRALGASGSHKALKVASKSTLPPTKRSPVATKSLATGRHKALQSKKSLNEQLLDEAREVELSESGIRKLPKSDSLLSKMFGKLTKS